MLNIFYGDMKEAVYNTAAYFKYDYEDNWITDPFVKKMIKDVDQSIVLNRLTSESLTRMKLYIPWKNWYQLQVNLFDGRRIR